MTRVCACDRAGVAGTVPEKPSHPDRLCRLPGSRAAQAAWVRSMEWQWIPMPFGIPRLMGWCGTSMPGAARRVSRRPIQQAHAGLPHARCHPRPAAERPFPALWYPLREGSSHYIAPDRPDAVIAAIREVVAQCRRQ